MESELQSTPRLDFFLKLFEGRFILFLMSLTDPEMSFALIRSAGVSTLPAISCVGSALVILVQPFPTVFWIVAV